MSAAVVRAACGLVLCLLATGCGGDVVVLDEIDGDEVGRMAEQELQAENPWLTAGTMSCPDLDFEVGASVRCLRTTELSGGRVVKVGGTVEVSSRASGGRLHVAMDGDAQEFGLTGARVAAALRERTVRRFGSEPSRVECPYLRGEVGTTVSCRLKLDGDGYRVDAVVTAVDVELRETEYVFRAHRPAS